MPQPSPPGAAKPCPLLPKRKNQPVEPISRDQPSTGAKPMPFEVYDFRDVNKNVLTTPEIRARLYHMEPGQVDRLHSHDLGHEIFLILEGKAEFMIAGHTEVLEAGQMCVALADEIHQVRNLLPDRRTVMFLSVTPHIQPTHTGRDPDGSVHPAPVPFQHLLRRRRRHRPNRRPARHLRTRRRSPRRRGPPSRRRPRPASPNLAQGRRRPRPGRSRSRPQHHVASRPQLAHQPLQTRPALEQASPKSRRKRQ